MKRGAPQQKVQPIPFGRKGAQLALEKGLPANIDAERFILGSILLDDARFIDVAGIVSNNDFALEKHRRIFGRMSEMHARGEKIDRVTVANELMRFSELESVDGLSYLVSLDDGLPHISNLGSYLRIIRNKSTLRRIAMTAQHVMNRALMAEDDPEEILVGAAEMLESIGKTCGASAAIADLPAVGELQDLVRYIREPELPEGAVIGLTGDSGSGKSTLATAWARDAIASGRACLFLDRENPRSVVHDRMARLGLNDGPMLRWFGGWSGDDDAPLPDAQAVVEWVTACDPKPVVVIDSTVAFMAGSDENSASDMRKFLHRARRLADLGATVIVLHHDGKADTAKDFRGSSDFKAALDGAFHCTNISSDSRLDRIRLRCFKSRYGFCGEIVYHYADGRMVRDERSHAPERTAAELLTGILRLNPGITGGDFEAKAFRDGIARSRVREFVNDGVLEGSIDRKTGSKNTKRYMWIGGEK
jgi:hypothetical protein